MRCGYERRIERRGRRVSCPEVATFELLTVPDDQGELPSRRQTIQPEDNRTLGVPFQRQRRLKASANDSPQGEQDIMSLPEDAEIKACASFCVNKPVPRQPSCQLQTVTADVR